MRFDAECDARGGLVGSCRHLLELERDAPQRRVRRRRDPSAFPVPGEATVNLGDVRMIVAHAFECSSAVLDRAGHRWAS
jgi:hypothetical protein